MKSKVLVQMAREENNPAVIRFSGLDRIWMKDYRSRRKEKQLKYILEFVPEENLFSVLITAVENQKNQHQQLIKERVDDAGMRMLALSCSGEPFPAAEVLELFRDSVDQIREIGGDPEWKARFFAVSLLLHDGSDRSTRVLEESLRDSHPLVRKTVIQEIQNDRIEDLYGRLESSLVHDAAFEVREAAWYRIQKDFPRQYTVDPGNLGTVEAFHVLDFLDPRREDHVNLAIELLDSKNLELRHPAAAFLDRIGWLKQTLNEADPTDKKDLERRERLLGKAAEVQVWDFLYRTGTKPASLYLALKMLERSGDRLLIPPLAERGFNNINGEDSRVWEQGIKVLNLRPSDSGTALLVKELDRHRYDSGKAAYILTHLNIRDDKRVVEILLNLLLDTSFTEHEALRKAFSQLKTGTVLPRLKEILRSERGEYSHSIRITALKIIADYGHPYLVQMILEQLPTIPPEQAGEFTRVLHHYAGKEFSSRVDELLAQPDGKIRAAVIASIPVEEKKRISKEIRAALKDAEPDVRISALRALVDLGDTRTINLTTDLLRDPVERVRAAAGDAMGVHGSDSTIDELKGVIDDPHEVSTVKEAGIRGLGASESKTALSTLVHLLSEFQADDELYEPVIQAISRRSDSRRIESLLEHMKDAEPELRDRLVNCFARMGNDAEDAVRDLLEQDLASLKPQLVEILEQTGYVEKHIRLLGDRDPQVRRDAAKFLAKVGSVSSYRGIVLAARDPDEDVRVMVTKALEYLAGKEGHEILSQLREDPQKRVRKYTEWALQRLHAKDVDDESGS
ncbi:HEAT repeat domain-containing protein [Salinispira pacifica]|uniref:HEAT repeat domain-containing protein n=1 Tax=Salinispira pacifica TaxID=1307761 RepID=UPI00146FB61F|nr:HEAT repeat domain-containing protein [Salinispira pacifica]